MLWLKLLVAIGAGLTANLCLADELERPSRQIAEFNCTPIWHYKFPPYTSPQLRAIYDGVKMKICYRDAERSNSVTYYSCVDTQDYFTFVNTANLSFTVISHLSWLLYDDSKTQPNTQLSKRGVYPAIIGVTNQDAYSSVDDNKSWLRTCDNCIKSTVKVVNSEVFKSSSNPPFWASFNDGNRIITSPDMKNWTLHDNLDTSVGINSIFPIKMNGVDKWVLMQYINNIYNFYDYYVGNMTLNDGFLNESPPTNFTYGGDDAELFFANKGDIVDDSQYLLVVFVNTYFTVFGIFTLRNPIILGTPRKVMFKDVGGTMRLVQEPLVDVMALPIKYSYIFENKPVSEGINPLNNIIGTSFTITNMTFNLQNSKEVAILIRKSRDGMDYVKIGFLKQDVYYVDRGKSVIPGGLPSPNSDKYRRRFDARISKALDYTALQFSIYADRCLLEVFAEYFTINFNLIILSSLSSNRMELISSREPATLNYIQIIGYD